MGKEPNVAQIVIREHLRRPISGSVLLLGRQTMSFSPSDAIEMIRAFDISIPEGTVATDRQTVRSREGEFI